MKKDLQVTLQDLFPSGRFSPPASEGAIAEAQSKLGVRIPPQLRRLYLQCDGFREDRGNSKYLFSLTADDGAGSLVGTTHFLWHGVEKPKLWPLVFFGHSGGGDYWGINALDPFEVVAYHHNMNGEFMRIGTDIIDVYRKDYSEYEMLDG